MDTEHSGDCENVTGHRVCLQSEGVSVLSPA